ncbi:hypothetical protein Pcinc_030927 [Petrolisthes cinctipes]|uniref:GDSL esterase/lipase n=1 Tax=Petrolisthes cinctipes TaxID=88211 RepID=A0AAE1EXQ5_PETCI|nr:hypothetical protein Pcinc_030927 [Petrolisthes cinctipes]
MKMNVSSIMLLVPSLLLLLLQLLLLLPGTCHASPLPPLRSFTSTYPSRSQYRRGGRVRYPSRKPYSNHPLAGLLPSQSEVYYFGFDSTGYSRNGRDLSHVLAESVNQV